MNEKPKGVWVISAILRIRHNDWSISISCFNLFNLSSCLHLIPIFVCFLSYLRYVEYMFLKTVLLKLPVDQHKFKHTYIFKKNNICKCYVHVSGKWIIQLLANFVVFLSFLWTCLVCLLYLYCDVMCYKFYIPSVAHLCLLSSLIIYIEQLADGVCFSEQRFLGPCLCFPLSNFI